MEACCIGDLSCIVNVTGAKVYLSFCGWLASCGWPCIFPVESKFCGWPLTHFEFYTHLVDA